MRACGNLYLSSPVFGHLPSPRCVVVLAPKCVGAPIHVRVRLRGRHGCKHARTHEWHAAYTLYAARLGTLCDGAFAVGAWVGDWGGSGTALFEWGRVPVPAEQSTAE